MNDFGEEPGRMSGRAPHADDVAVGRRVRIRRNMLGMSQETLASKMGLSFQQIQKYEKGTNRIGASRMKQIAKVLNIHVGFFFDEEPIAKSPDMEAILDALSNKEVYRLNLAFIHIRDSKMRRRLVDLARAMSGEDDEAGEQEAA